MEIMRDILGVAGVILLYVGLPLTIVSCYVRRFQREYFRELGFKPEQIKIMMERGWFGC